MVPCCAQMAPCWLKMATCWPKVVPKMALGLPHHASDGPMLRQYGPTVARMVPSWSPECPTQDQDDFMLPQDGPKLASRRCPECSILTKMAPRCPEATTICSRWFNVVPRWPLDGSMLAQDGPEMVACRPKMHPCCPLPRPPTCLTLFVFTRAYQLIMTSRPLCSVIT